MNIKDYTYCLYKLALTRVFEFVKAFLFFLNTRNHIVEKPWYLCCAAAASVYCNVCLLQSGDVLAAVWAEYDSPECHLHQTPHLLAGE